MISAKPVICAYVVVIAAETAIQKRWKRIEKEVALDVSTAGKALSIFLHFNMLGISFWLQLKMKLDGGVQCPNDMLY